MYTIDQACTAFRMVRREVGCLTTSFFKKPPEVSDEAARAFSLFTMRMVSGLTVYEAFRGIPGIETFNCPEELDPMYDPCCEDGQMSKGVVVLSMEDIEIWLSVEDLLANPGVDASR